MLRFISFTLLIACTPLMTNAASAPNDFRGFVALVLDAINTITSFLLAILFVVVVWGIINGWVIHGGDEKGVESGKKVLFAGIVAFVILASFWGIIALVRNSFFG